MRLLFLGDIVGKTARTSLAENLSNIKKKLSIEFVLANAENATSGVGLSATHAKLLFDAGVNCISLGDHAFDQNEMINFAERENRIIRPINYAKSAPGSGFRIFNLGVKKILILQVLGQVFMKKPFSDPFEAIETYLKKYTLNSNVDAIIIDFHAEATSEKNALALHLDGRVSVIAGTHTHIPTADTRILPNGTAYQTDLGMCGDYLSVIGMEKTEPIRRFITGMSKERFRPADGEATLSGIILGSFVPDELGLKFAIPLTFIAIIVQDLKKMAYWEH